MSETLTTEVPPKPQRVRIRKCHMSFQGMDGKQYRVSLDPVGEISIRERHGRYPMRLPIQALIRKFIQWRDGSLELWVDEVKGVK